MRDEQTSTTAAIVAAARGAAGVDPFAERLAPRALNRIAFLLPLVRFMRVRTVAIDNIVEHAVETGVDQVVILGAGLDARAWRLEALSKSTVFEVDHPATQATKRRRLDGYTPLAKLCFVAVDFERDDLLERLRESGHDAKKPTTWIWEGVTPYLTPDAINGTLRAIRSVSPPGSRLAMTYNPSGLRTMLSRPAFVILGESLRGLMTSAQAMSVVSDAGFTVVDDGDYLQLARRMDLPRPLQHIPERLLEAQILSTL